MRTSGRLARVIAEIVVASMGAALLACAWAYLRLEQTLHDLEFITFAPQPMALPEAPVAHVRGARS